jgi:hypothetical protein
MRPLTKVNRFSKVGRAAGGPVIGGPVNEKMSPVGDDGHAGLSEALVEGRGPARSWPFPAVAERVRA